jgi:glycosyltransferase involved in cell wall biosynthesis
MRVVLVSDVYFPRVNGVSTSIRTFRSDLDRLGVDTALVVPEYSAAPAFPDDALVSRVPATRVPFDPEDYRMRWTALVQALDAACARGVDLVHVQTPFLAHYAGVRAARRAGVPVVATYHTFFEEYLHHYMPVMPRAWGRALARRFTRSQCRDVAALVAPSAPMRDQLLEYGVDTPIHVLPTGLPADRFQAGDGARFRAAHRIPSGVPLLLYVGRVAHEKNIDFLLRMFVDVRAARPDALLLVAGEGPARAALRDLAQSLELGDAVRFVGYLDRDSALLDCYAAGDVFVFASRTETQGLVLLEAMAQGTPVVSTAVLGTRSILKPGCGARIVEENEEAFATAVLDVLGDETLREELACEARPYAAAWSSMAMAERLVELYRGVVASRARAPHPDEEGAAGSIAPRRA